jgi:hypothetical protein
MKMSCLRWRYVVALGFLLSLSALQAQSPTEKENGPKEERWHQERKLTLSAQPIQQPVLQYQLFPLASQRKPGNAAPIYLRFAQGRPEKVKQELVERGPKWLELPLNELPRQEVHQLLGFHRYVLNQMDLAARRQTCDWDYTLDVDDPLSILLPDAQEMRTYLRLLAIKARLETLEGHFPQAVRTLETGLSFSQQVSTTPFLISGLVGLAGGQVMTDVLLDLMERPNSPNLYWALTALPRPLFDLRNAFEMEQNMMTLLFPDLTDLDRPRSSEEWEAVLARVRKKIDYVRQIAAIEANPQPLANAVIWAQTVPEAHKYLMQKRGLTDKQVKAMPQAQVLLRHLADQYRDLSDDHFKTVYLPFAVSRPFREEVKKRLQELQPRTPAIELAQCLLPALDKVLLAQVRFERKVAALRVIEALRLHAAATGKLPESLNEIQLVPVPPDPATGQPFSYERKGETAVLLSKVPGETVAIAGLRLWVTLRK